MNLKLKNYKIIQKERNIFSEFDINSEVQSVEKVTVSVAPRTGRTGSLQNAPLPNRRYYFHKMKLDAYVFKVAQVRESFHVFLFYILVKF